jgi:hypothetical protein
MTNNSGIKFIYAMLPDFQKSLVFGMFQGFTRLSSSQEQHAVDDEHW